MARIAMAALLAAAVGIAVPVAQAADMPVKGPIYKAPVVEPVLPWTGFYFGGSIGARFATSDWTSALGAARVGPADPRSAMNNADVRYGGQIGYNRQIADWVIGIEGDFGYANNHSTSTPALGTNGTVGGVNLTNLPTGTIREKWDGSIRGRLGVLVPWDNLIYVTGGGAAQQVELSASCVGGAAPSFCSVPHNETFDKLMWGWTAGAGMEKMLTPNWIVRLDYRYADFGNRNQVFFSSVGADAFTADVHIRTHTLTTGISYKF